MRFFLASILAVGLIAGVACSKPPLAAESATSTPEAKIQQIPAADSQKYASMRDMKAWRNPYLIIRVDGVALLDAANNEQQMVPSEKLPDALAKLPASSWPYGRVVAIQEVGASASEEDKARLRRNRALVAGTLESMHVLINWVPSA
jgi:hypothetical protein